MKSYENHNKDLKVRLIMYILKKSIKLLIIGGSGSGKTNALLNLISNQPDIDKIDLYTKDPL